MKAVITHISIVIKAILITSLLANHSWVLAQSDIVPVTYENYFLNPGFINPAITAPTDRFECRISSRILVGPFDNVNSSLVQGTLAIKKNQEGAQQYIGAIFQTEKEGKFLSRNRFYGLYALKIPLKSRLALNAGAALGALNYSVLSSTTNGGGSAMGIDGKVGTWLHSPSWSIGISVNQLFNNTFQPFSASLRLKRFISLYGNYKHTFNENCHVTLFYTMNNYGSNKLNNYYSVNMVLGLGKVLQVGGGFRINQGAVGYGGLRNIEIGKKQLQVGFSYFVPMYQILSINNVVEFSIVLY